MGKEQLLEAVDMVVKWDRRSFQHSKWAGIWRKMNQLGSYMELKIPNVFHLNQLTMLMLPVEDSCRG